MSTENSPERTPRATTDPTVSKQPTFWRLIRPKNSMSHYTVALLCVLLGIAVVMQVQAGQQDDLDLLRESDLVQLLDEGNRQTERLDDAIRELEGTLRELESGSDAAIAARKLAEERAVSQGILTGRLQASGPGIILRIPDRDGGVRAHHLVSVLQEARNSGVEVAQLNDVRLTARSYFLDGPNGIVLDGKVLSAPYEFIFIGDPATVTPALGIPGGALAALRNVGAEPRIDTPGKVLITATVKIAPLNYAEPFDPDESR